MNRRTLRALPLLLLAACTGYGGRGLVVGESVVGDVQRLMGAPAMEWTGPDGSRQLAYPRGPAGVHTYMAHFAPDGRLAAFDNVLTPESFARIQAGMRKDEVLRLIGPSRADWTVYFERRDELAMEWRFCDDWNQLARFAVLFDAGSGIVRSTLIQSESQISTIGEHSGFWCAR